MGSKKFKHIIGRKEKISFPELKLQDIDAKIDTGAYTSSIHCSEIKASKEGDTEMISFRLLDHQHPDYNHKLFKMPLHDKRKIKSSFGDLQTRYVIKTKVEFFEQLYDIELSLADRSKMEYPVLLGRKLLMKNFLVDVSRVNLSNKLKKKHS